VAHATVAVNGIDLADWTFRAADTPGQRRVVVPRSLVADTGVMLIEFKVDDPVSPAELLVSSDTRRLGVSLQSLTVTAADGR
jgi:hypothetical protein